jgi:hypothetical protein
VIKATISTSPYVLLPVFFVVPSPEWFIFVVVDGIVLDQIELTSADLKVTTYYNKY